MCPLKVDHCQPNSLSSYAEDAYLSHSAWIDIQLETDMPPLEDYSARHTRGADAKLASELLKRRSVNVGADLILAVQERQIVYRQASFMTRTGIRAAGPVGFEQSRF